MDRFIVISGCSGGGKSSLLRELAARAYATVDEPGRRVVKQELVSDGGRLPWTDMAAFAQCALELAVDDHHNAINKQGTVFFDRGIVDAASALFAITADETAAVFLNMRVYNSNVFVAPPWPEIFVQDDERRHGFDDAKAEYERLVCAYCDAGYQIHLLPKVGVAQRADFVIDALLSF